MSNQPNDPSTMQKSGAQQSGNPNKMGQQQVGGSAGNHAGDVKKPGDQGQAATPTKVAPARQPGSMPNPI